MVDVWLTYPQIVELGVSEATIWRKTKSGAWASRIGKRLGTRGAPPKEVLLASLPPELQARWLQRRPPIREETHVEATPTVSEPPSDSLDTLQIALKRFPLDEREAWIAEVQRLAEIAEKYERISPKRIKHVATNKHEFVPAVFVLCHEAACTNQVILAREPHRAAVPSPYTLDGWLRSYRKHGFIAFLRSDACKQAKEKDKRKAAISEAAIEWVNRCWRNYRSPRALYKALSKKAKQEKWTIPAESWIYRQWKQLPEIVIVKHLKGEKEYVSKYAPYIPRTAFDLAALQLLCGDHRQCDVFVLWRDGKTLIRPWLTLWQDVRTGLIWGWHLDVTPSSQTIGLAYASGVMVFGAQPPARPDEGFQSYVYTDNGRDYKSHHLDGRITIHKRAAALDGSFELIRTQQRVGLYSEVDVQKLFARGYNAKEKPVERTNRDLANWEEQEFDEWCGRDAKNKPDLYRDLYHQHQRFIGGHRGESPFMAFDTYLEALSDKIIKYNSSEHTRSVLENARIVPLQEYERLYPTRFPISEGTLAMMLMKAERRVIGKIGVGCKEAYPTWRYFHPGMSEFKGKEVEVRYDGNDLSRVFVILPNGQMCEAELWEKSGYLTPNKQTAKLLKETEARERRMQREHNLLTLSLLRSETLEERVAAQYETEEIVEAVSARGGNGGTQANIRRITRLDKPILRGVQSRTVTAAQVTAVEPDDSIFIEPARGAVSEFDFEE
jgi:hypothetical protein